MRTVYFICDESGAKGYADKSEQYFGEVGIVAGYFIPETHIDMVKQDLANITSQFVSSGKLHITDLPDNDKQALREQIFKYFIDRNVICTYEAVFSEGFHKNHTENVNRLEKARINNTSSVRLNEHEKVEMLHAELLVGAFAKVVSFGIDNVGNDITFKIITDNIDKPIIKMFQKMANKFLNIEDETKTVVTGWDKANGVKTQRTITTKISNSSEFLLDLSKITYEISCELSPLTVAADVLANSINYYFRSKPNALHALPNKPDAIRDHPLHSLFYGLWEEENFNWAADAIFMHPEYEEYPE